ncbi:hypothetical protein KUCAC02_030062, partial [Chaenocephalus aceratus]
LTKLHEQLISNMQLYLRFLECPQRTEQQQAPVVNRRHHLCAGSANGPEVFALCRQDSIKKPG